MSYLNVTGPTVTVGTRPSDGLITNVLVQVAWGAQGNWFGGGCGSGRPGWFVMESAPAYDGTELEPGGLDVSYWETARCAISLDVGGFWESHNVLCDGHDAVGEPRYDAVLIGPYGLELVYAIEIPGGVAPPGAYVDLVAPITLADALLTVGTNLNIYSGSAALMYTAIDMPGSPFVPAPPDLIDPPIVPRDTIILGPCGATLPTGDEETPLPP